ncbi:MAG: DUF4252 domain-containing protein [Candidatus Solibacter usitatus]|nr:DUF4252 domain-containing protein [Candidatus Solibacter usitatus]
MRTFTLLVCLASFGLAQQLDLKFLDHLAGKTDEVVTLTLGEDLLKLGAGLIVADKDPDSRKVKDAIGGLRQILVRSYKFKQDGEYSPADVDKIYAQLKGPGWSQVLEAREKKGRTTIHMRTSQNAAGGMVIVSAEPRELTVVAITGSIDMEKLGQLGGNFGIPEVKDAKKPAAKQEEEDLL